MTTTPFDAQAFARAHFNEPVLVGTELARLVGYAEDSADAYYVLRRLHGRLSWHTAVGGVLPLDGLKGQHPVVPLHPSYAGEIWDDFFRANHALLNAGVGPEEAFILDLRPDEHPFESELGAVGDRPGNPPVDVTFTPHSYRLPKAD